MKEIGKNAVFYFNSKNSIKNAKLINKKLKLKKQITQNGFTNLKRFKFSKIKRNI